MHSRRNYSSFYVGLNFARGSSSKVLRNRWPVFRGRFIKCKHKTAAENSCVMKRADVARKKGSLHAVDCLVFHSYSCVLGDVTRDTRALRMSGFACHDVKRNYNVSPPAWTNASPPYTFLPDRQHEKSKWKAKKIGRENSQDFSQLRHSPRRER